MLTDLKEEIDSWRLQYPTFNNRCVFQTENLPGNFGYELHFRTNGPKRHMQIAH